MRQRAFKAIFDVKTTFLTTFANLIIGMDFKCPKVFLLH